MSKPIIAITMGDPNGIGPEIILRALAEVEGWGASFLVFGSVAVFDALGLGLERQARGVEWIDVGGGADPGRMQVESLSRAVDALREGRADGLCTAPITKIAARAAGFPFPGHTEYLAHSFGVTRFAMMLAGPGLRVVPLTGHLPMRAVSAALTPELVAARIVVTVQALVESFGIAEPELAVAGLNPHAGEGGMLGDEEARCLAPGLALAREQLARLGLPGRIRGPLPADALFVPPVRYDAVLCCYHDQAMIPIKMLCRDEAVNVTLGLPTVRTSPAHGSALDIAGQGVARPQSMIAALRLAVELAARRAGY